MNYAADVIIIGSGPGGGMAACRLAESGLRVLVLEKAVLPRHKPCGGGLPNAVRGVIDWDFSALVENEVTALHYLFDYGSPVRDELSQPVLMVDRSRFDRHFIERALQLGGGNVTLRENSEVDFVEESERAVAVVLKSGARVLAPYLIAADGVWSRTAKSLGIKRRAHLAAAIDVEIEVDDEIYAQHAHTAQFNFGCLPNGYGWVFPKNGILSCGVGAWRGRPRLVASMDDFLARTFPKGSIRSEKRYGYPLPLYAGPQTVATPRVCLVGDAAGLVDPVMGEGIRFALRSGETAAHTVMELLGARPFQNEESDAPPEHFQDCRRYENRIRRGIGREFEALHHFIVPLFFKKPEYFYRTFFEQRQSYDTLARQLAARMEASH